MHPLFVIWERQLARINRASSNLGRARYAPPGDTTASGMIPAALAARGGEGLGPGRGCIRKYCHFRPSLPPRSLSLDALAHRGSAGKGGGSYFLCSLLNAFTFAETERKVGCFQRATNDDEDGEDASSRSQPAHPFLYYEVKNFKRWIRGSSRRNRRDGTAANEDLGGLLSVCVPSAEGTVP